MSKSKSDVEDDSPDEELVAYLDGEVDEAAAREIEQKVAQDQTTRTKVQTLKKTYDLLDYLPRPEPSVDFATKTVTQILPQSSLPGESSSSSGVGLHQSRGLAWPWLTIAAALAILIGVALGFATHPGPPKEEPLTPDLLPLLARLPLYVGVDDLELLQRLDQPDLFAEMPNEFAPHTAVTFERSISPEMQQKHFEYFRQLPAARRRDIVQLDQQLRDLPEKERDRLGQVLENYAVWLDSLPAPLRKEVLDAPNRDQRLKVIEEVRVKDWQETLSRKKKEQIKLTIGVEEKAELLRKWQSMEKEQKQEWLTAATQWKSARDGKKPWPFSDETLRGEIDSYVKNVLKFDPKQELKQPRLSANELQRMTFLRRETELDRGWLQYGAFLLELSERHEMLPEPRNGSPITKLDQLSEPLKKRLTNTLRKKQYDELIDPKSGKWPDFALAVHSNIQDKTFLAANPKLGPCKPGEFTEPVDNFLTTTLLPKLKDSEKQALKNQEGKWPEYPRKMINLAQQNDLSVPGVTLPGKPSLWKQYYRYTPVNTDKPVSQPTTK